MPYQNYRAEKFRSVCKQNYYTKGRVGAFMPIPMYIEECLTEFTIFGHEPLFDFPNGIKFYMNYQKDDLGLCWKCKVIIGELESEILSEFDVVNMFSASTTTLAEFVMSLYYLDEKTAEEMIKVTQNPKRRKYKTWIDLLDYPKFKEEIQKSSEKSHQLAISTEPFRSPKEAFKKYLKEIKYSPMNSQIKPMEYEMIYEIKKTKMRIKSKLWKKEEEYSYIVEIENDKENISFSCMGIIVIDKILEFIKESKPSVLISELIKELEVFDFTVNSKEKVEDTEEKVDPIVSEVKETAEKEEVLNRKRRKK